MTIREVLLVLGPIAGVAMLVVMAIVPLLLDLPLPRPVAHPVPARRGASPSVGRRHAATS